MILLFGVLSVACQAGGSSSQEASSAIPLIGTVPSSNASSNAPISSPTASSFANNTSTAPVPVKLTYILPTSSSATSSSAKSVYRRLQYISTSNTSITIIVTPIGGSASTYGPTACSTASCVISFTANPGPNTIAFSLTDGTNILSSFSTTTIIQPTTLNTLNLTANPVVRSVTLQLASATENAGTPSNDLVTVNAKDADGNTIVGNAPYIDANGNALALTLDVTNNQLGGKGTVTIKGPSYITAPAQAAIYAHYDGNWLSNSMISVTSTSAAVTSLTGVTLTSVPYDQEFTVTDSPQEILWGPDGNLWISDYLANAVTKMTPTGTVTNYPCGLCSTPQYMTMGPDGNIWLMEDTGSYVDKVSLNNGALTRVAAITADGGAITVGADGNLWFGEYTSNLIGRITTAGVLTEFSVPKARGFTSGPDGNLWGLSVGNTTITKYSPNTGAVLASYPIASDGTSDGIVTGPDGNLWFANNGSDSVERVTTNGTVTSYALTTGASPRSIVVGPDNAMWFTESGLNGIGRVTTSGTVTEYSTANGISGTSSPRGITVGGDGNIWIAERGAKRIGKFVL